MTKTSQVRLTAVAVSLLLLTGCAATHHTASAPIPASAPATATADPSPAPASITDAVTVVGGTDYVRSASPAPGSVEWGTFTLNGDSGIQIYQFANADGVTSFLEAVSGFGITESQLAWSPDKRFAVSPHDQTTIPALTAALQKI